MPGYDLAALEARLGKGRDKFAIKDRLTSEEVGFVIRTGPDAAHRNRHTLEVDATEIVIHAGKQELLYNARLKLNYGKTYGLIGRNGVGKSTMLRSIMERDGRVEIPSHMITIKKKKIYIISKPLRARASVWCNFTLLEKTPANLSF